MCTKINDPGACGKIKHNYRGVVYTCYFKLKMLYFLICIFSDGFMLVFLLVVPRELLFRVTLQFKSFAVCTF